MEPVISITLNKDYTSLGDWDQREVNWLLTHMDWSVTPVGDYIVVNFFIPVTK